MILFHVVLVTTKRDHINKAPRTEQALKKCQFSFLASLSAS